jgi:hypothetical protein
MPALTLGRKQYLYLTLTFVLMGLLIWWAVFHPAVYHQWCIRYYIPSVQERFGFRVGRISVPGLPYQPLALVEVTAGGPLSWAGFRVGDIPVDHHGGETAFCGALQGAERSGYSNITVINADDWDNERRSRRELTIPSVAR